VGTCRFYKIRKQQSPPLGVGGLGFFYLMKKLITIITSVLVLAALSTNIQAQAFEKGKLHVGGGLGFASGNTAIIGHAEYAFADFLGLGAATSIGLSPTNFDLGVRGAYHFAVNEQVDPYAGIQYMFTNSGRFEAMGGLKYWFSDKIGGMFEVGLLFNPGVTTNGTVITTSSTTAQFRVGVALKIGN
jgi:hypothetical protein